MGVSLARGGLVGASKFEARICIGGRQRSLGSFTTPEEVTQTGARTLLMRSDSNCRL
jgi:hypothetical protein